MANQTAIYQYTWKSGWTIDSSTNSIDNDAIQNDIRNGMKKGMLEQLTQKFAGLGRWLKVDSVNVDIASYNYFVRAGVRYVHAEGTTTTIFQSDATPDEDFAPATGFMGWDDVLLAIAEAILLIILAHPLWFFALLILIALTVFALAGGFQAVLFGPGAGALGNIGTIIAIAILGFGGLLVLFSVFGKGRSPARPRRARRS